ncbi:hypothetical protein OG401_23925 [Kitasatospora purpeofusca]|uniref:hypothetical protein n=1 Tax=Kitasatospora purpeofusca TaxID=67352 RepID=UPI0022545A6A|nr:hypothetical protein [Kitasatospora purpeofusca]MCX4687313.1 hypothetical protein [Kitasatospora purpeofusca]
MSEAKRKGTAWETTGCDYLNDVTGKYRPDWKDLDRSVRWVDPSDPENVRRQVQEGRADIGDAHARPFALEFKAEQRFNLPEYIRQANAEARNAGLPYGVAVVKAPRKNVSAGYVVMDLATFARVLTAVRTGTTSQ